ncbi:MAG: 3-isopropylmalate dehydratase small subunit [Acidobacteriota bacterium]|nr:MAG: 3-isopropylmalate dehydratase small subunit [Acidobacteriota bacterium]
MKKITEVKGTGIFVEGDDVDTDQIIPAKFLKCVTFNDLGKHVFYNARFGEDGNAKEHPFNDGRFSGSSILVVNKNFGCGSSREHAPQALLRFGIKAIVGESFAEIFSGNCIANGLAIAAGPKEDIRRLMNTIRENPTVEIRLDLVSGSVEYDGCRFGVEQRESHRRSLIEGTWDPLDEMLQDESLVERVRAGLPYAGAFQDEKR